MASRLVIYRGDDTGGAFGRALVFTMNVREGVTLEGCRGEWIFDGIVKTLAGPISDGEEREIFYSHNETQRMPLGVRFGTFRIVDAAGKIRTVDNAVPVEVTDILSRVYPGSSSRTFDIGYTVTWGQIALKPSVVSTINGQEPDENGNFEIEAGGTVKSATVNGGEKTLPTGDGNLALEIGAHDVGTLTEGEINDKINAFAAHYLTATAEGAAFATEAALTGATAFYYAGESATPTKNDYCIVLADAQGKTSRWSFVGTWGEGGSWQRQYAINDTQFSESQWNAINSGATAAKIAEINGKMPIVPNSIQVRNNDEESLEIDLFCPAWAGETSEESHVRIGFLGIRANGGKMIPYSKLATDDDIKITKKFGEWQFKYAEEWMSNIRMTFVESPRVGWVLDFNDTREDPPYGPYREYFIGGNAESTTLYWEEGDFIIQPHRTFDGFVIGARQGSVMLSIDALRSAVGMTDANPAPLMAKAKLAAAPTAEDESERARALFTSDNPVLAQTTAGAVEDAATLDEDGKPASETMQALCSSANAILGETIGAQIASAIGPVDDALDEALGEEVA